MFVSRRFLIVMLQSRTLATNIIRGSLLVAISTKVLHAFDNLLYNVCGICGRFHLRWRVVVVSRPKRETSDERGRCQDCQG